MFDYWKRFCVGLFTDLYQLTMAAGYFANHRHNMWACFHLFFRNAPFKDRKAVLSGLEIALDYLRNIQFDKKAIDALADLKGNDGKRIFSDDFLDELRNFKLRVTVDAVREGSIVFANEPLLRVSGPLWQCQLVESALLNIINFNTLISTKTARIVVAADGKLVFDFGLRRAQGPDGALSAARAAFIAGACGSSNVNAKIVWGIPVKGTHAHSWVMSFPTEVEAFDAYAAALPNNGVYLVDTYNPIQGIKHAIQTFKNLEALGYQGIGIRLDSGDLCELSVAARKMLNGAGLDYIKIFASDSLNEHKIAELNERGALIDVWGVGTNLITAQDQPALGGVYKLGSILYPATGLQPAMKVSATPAKSTNPGILNTARVYDPSGAIVTDIIYDDTNGIFPEIPLADIVAINDKDLQRRITERQARHESMLMRVVDRGQQIYKTPDIFTIQEYCLEEQARYAKSIDGLILNKQGIPVHLQQDVAHMKAQLMAQHAELVS